MGRIVLVGCLEAGFEMLKELLLSNFKIDFIVGISENVAKKNLVSGYANFANLAKQNDIPYYEAKSYSLTNKEDVNFFETNKFDLLIQGGWQRLFPEVILNTLKIGAIGIHGSSELLPKGRGRSPMNWCLIEGKTNFILQFFLIKSGVDDGDIFAYDEFDITPFDTIKTLYYKNAILSRNMYLKYVPLLLSNKCEFTPQVGEPSYYAKRSREDGKINWGKNVDEIYNLIRAVSKPYPGAYTTYRDTEIIIWKAQPFDYKLKYPEARIGEIVEYFSNSEIVVKCKDGLLLISEYEASIQLTKELIFDFN